MFPVDKSLTRHDMIVGKSGIVMQMAVDQIGQHLFKRAGVPRDFLNVVPAESGKGAFGIDSAVVKNECVNTFKEVGRITNLTSPRYIHFLSDEKAYVTQIWDNRIFIINPKRYQVTGYIEVPNMTMESGSTEQIVQYGKYVYINCWSYQNRILKIDTETDQIVAELTVGIQPTSLALDCNNKLWTVTDGGYEGSPYGYETPSLYRIDAESFTIEKQFEFTFGDWPSEVQLNGTKDKIYWLNDDVWEMDVTANNLPAEPFLPYNGTLYYGLTICPKSGDVYIADAIDYVQQGMIYRYSKDKQLIDSFYVGIIPGAFCWK